jgi:hypothetical protein
MGREKCVRRREEKAQENSERKGRLRTEQEGGKGEARACLEEALKE